MPFFGMGRTLVPTLFSTFFAADALPIVAPVACMAMNKPPVTFAAFTATGCASGCAHPAGFGIFKKLAIVKPPLLKKQPHKNAPE
jgi:hypothetical protein